MFTSTDLAESSPSHQLSYVQKKCSVCEGPAAQHFHYGVAVCSACGMFFKRNATSLKKILRCSFDGHCAMNISFLLRCPSCRIKKCYAIGMTEDKFRPSRPTKSNKYSLVKLKDKHQPESLPTLNLLRADRSALGFDEWALISNLYHTYEHSELLSIAERLITAHNTPPASNNVCLKLVEEYLVSVYNTTGKYLCSNADLRQLSYDDRSPVLRNIADHVTCLGSIFLIDHCHLYDLAMFFDLIKRKYGRLTVELQIWASNSIDPDILIVKLAIGLFALSANSCLYSSDSSISLSNPIHLLNIQNKYATITWKYLLYKYGYHEGVMRFTRLISWLMATAVFMVQAQTLSIHVNEVHSLVEQTEMKLLIDDIDDTSE